MKHGEAQAHKTFEDAQRAVIKACVDLREAEMFLDSFERRERSAGGDAAAEYLAREGQQACGSRVASLSEVIANRHAAKFHPGDEMRENFNGLPESIKFRSDSEPSISINISVAQSDFKRVLLALHSLLDVVECGGRGGACSHCCHSSSSVRCGGRTCSCGVDGTSQPTGEEAARTTGGGGLPGSSAMTPTDRTTAEVPRFKFLRHREDGPSRE